MPPRLYVDHPFAGAANAAFELPPDAARHAQVLRLQPDSALRLFDGRGGEWRARVVRMGRSTVEVELLAHDPVDREAGVAVTLALGMPANERMDALVEKATELGVAAIQPLVTARSVLRLDGERAARRLRHWQAVAQAAAEQCGRTRLPEIHAVEPFARWLAAAPPPAGAGRWLLGFDDARPLAEMATPGRALIALSGPEGGLDADEQASARAAGYVPVSLGPRVLRADTAPLALLAFLGLVFPR